jgi:beta-1,4-mannosyltransferase
LIILSTYEVRPDAPNPFVWMVAEALRAEGVTFETLSRRRLLHDDADVMHIQWPERYFSKPELMSAWQGALKLFGFLYIARRRGLRVVLTMHNLEAHYVFHRRLERFAWRWVLRRLDGCIHLSEIARQEATGRYADLLRTRNVVIRHPAYPIPSTTISRSEARQAVGLPDNVRVLLYFGVIRPYKGITLLVQAFRDLTDSEAKLVVAGEVLDATYAEQVRTEAEGDPRVLLIGQRLEDDLDLWLAASDAVVLPYERVLNSGSALYALSRGRPILVPNIGSIPDLAAEVGENWVRTYSPGTLDATQLGATLTAAKGRPEDASPGLGRFELEAVAREMVTFYASLMAPVSAAFKPADCPASRIDSNEPDPIPQGTTDPSA